MLLIAMNTEMGTPEHPVGAVGCDRITPEADYTLLVRNFDGTACQCRLENYPRWTEPAVALVVRLLAQLPAERRSCIDGPVEYVGASVYLRSGLETTRPLEHLVVRRQSNRIVVEHADEFDSREVIAASRDEYRTPLDLMEHGGRLAVWGSDTIPPMPAPLTTVPVELVGGMSIVHERDIPGFVRPHFVARMRGRPAPQRGCFFATDWHRFIGAT